MYAIIETGGQQFRVEPGQTLVVPRLEGGDGAGVRFEKVLLLGGEDPAEVRIGTPTLEKVAVEAVLVRQLRGPKLDVFHRKRRKGYEKKTGHRQELTEIRITGISGA